MSKAFGLAADLHMHPWSAFSTTLPNGVNSRLNGQLLELRRLAITTKNAGGKFAVIAGDVFHVRGSVAPTVLNALRDEMNALSHECGITWIILSGNHDLEGRDSTRLGSAVTALEHENVRVVNAVTHLEELDMTLIPWIENIDELKEAISIAPRAKHLILHAPIDGVIPGLPDHGLTAEWISELGYGKVWSGHYHNYKEMAGGAVVSIGALCHHTWSDIGARAGFHVITEEGSTWHATHLPRFIDIDELVGSSITPEEVPMVVDGNYVRIRVEASKVKEVEDAREELLKMGAAGVLVRALPKPDAALTRVASTVHAGSSIEASVVDFAKATFATPELSADDIAREALDILNTVGAAE